MRQVARFSLAFILLIVIADRSVIYADDSVRLMVGRSTVVTTNAPIARVSLTSADVADALVTAPTELLVNGKMPGTISMFVWDRSGAIRRYEVIVQRDLARLSEQLKRVFPADSIDVQANGKSIVLSGTVSSKDVIERAAELAGGYVDKKEEIVSLLRVQEGAPTNQVLLRVRFAEVNRSAFTELGAGFFTSPTGVKNTVARVTTQQFPAPGFDQLKYTKADGKFGSEVTNASGQFTFTDFLNFFLFSEKYDLGMMIRALQTRGLFESLAEPNLVAESGKEASFLAGGEFPVPIAQGGTAGLAISVMFKEFGIRLNFVPVVTGNRVHLKVRPEVSTLDFTNAIVLQGFRIPALSTRRTETELELENGQTFAIAGLLNNTMNKSLQKVPGIGDIPILGLLFKSQAAQKNRTELVVMITPEILRSNSPGAMRELPRLQEPYLPPLEPKKSLPSPPPSFPPSSGGSSASSSGSPAASSGSAAPSSRDGSAAPSSAAVASGAAPGASGAVRAAVSSKAPSGPASSSASSAAPGVAAGRVTSSSESPASRDAEAAAEKVKALLPSSTPVAVHNGTMPNGTPAPSASAPAPAASAPTMTERDAKSAERARRQEHDREEAAKAAEGKARAKQIDAERKQQEKAAREEARREADATKAAAEAAKRQAALDKAANDAAAKRAAEEARKQAEIDKKNQKAVAEAEAKLKAAQAAYEAELAKTKRQQQQQN